MNSQGLSKICIQNQNIRSNISGNTWHEDLTHLYYKIIPSLSNSHLSRHHMFLFTKSGNCIKNEWHEHLTSLTFSKLEVTSCTQLQPESIGIFKFDSSRVIKGGIGREVSSLSRSCIGGLITVFILHFQCPSIMKHSGRSSLLS